MKTEVPSLTGLRFLAAFCVAFAHGSVVLLKIDGVPRLTWLSVPAGLGMTLFFVLSGFVIHYNYRKVAEEGISGVGRFLWARFSRLYPLFLFVIVVDQIFGRELYRYATGGNSSFPTILSALPYYLTFTHSWVYKLFESSSLIYVVAPNSSLSWSISTEWFFYLSYPVLALVIARMRGPRIMIAAMIAWSAIWISLASGLDSRSPEIDAWATNHFGAVAGVQLGYQDSFVRWLNYFSPYLRIGEFVLGCLVSHLFVQMEGRSVDKTEHRVGVILLALGLISIPTISCLTYSSASPFFHSLRSNYALAPSVALVIFTSARYATPWARLLNSPPFIALGEASYSIYMWHYLILAAVASSTGWVIPLGFWSVVYGIVRFVCALALVLLIALASYAWLEVPSRRFLRRLYPANASPKQARLAVGLVALPALCAVLLIGLPYLQANEEDPGTGLKLISATYGANCGAKLGNATQSVKRTCNGKESCSYKVDVTVLGDPAGGCAKSFIVEYTCGTDGRRTGEAPAEAGFGSQVFLTCASDTTPGSSK